MLNRFTVADWNNWNDFHFGRSFVVAYRDDWELLFVNWLEVMSDHLFIMTIMIAREFCRFQVISFVYFMRLLVLGQLLRIVFEMGFFLMYISNASGFTPPMSINGSEWGSKMRVCCSPVRLCFHLTFFDLLFDFQRDFSSFLTLLALLALLLLSNVLDVVLVLEAEVLSSVSQVVAFMRKCVVIFNYLRVEWMVRSLWSGRHTRSSNHWHCWSLEIKVESMILWHFPVEFVDLLGFPLKQHGVNFVVMVVVMFVLLVVVIVIMMAMVVMAMLFLAAVMTVVLLLFVMML